MPSQTIITQTLILAFRIAFVWAGGIFLAVAIRALLPDKFGLTFTNSRGTVVLSFSQLGFWTCIWAAVAVTILVVVRAMLADLAAIAAR